MFRALTILCTVAALAVSAASASAGLVSSCVRPRSAQGGRGREAQFDRRILRCLTGGREHPLTSTGDAVFDGSRRRQRSDGDGRDSLHA